MTHTPDERARLERLIARDGPEQARAWAQRTEAIYRSAVLDPTHFAHSGEYRRRYILAYLELKRFAREGAAQQPRSV